VAMEIEARIKDSRKSAYRTKSKWTTSRRNQYKWEHKVTRYVHNSNIKKRKI